MPGSFLLFRLPLLSAFHRRWRRLVAARRPQAVRYPQGVSPVHGVDLYLCAVPFEAQAHPITVVVELTWAAVYTNVGGLYAG